MLAPAAVSRISCLCSCTDCRLTRRAGMWSGVRVQLKIYYMQLQPVCRVRVHVVRGAAKPSEGPAKAIDRPPVHLPNPRPHQPTHRLLSPCFFFSVTEVKKHHRNILATSPCLKTFSNRHSREENRCQFSLGFCCFITF